MPSVPTIPTVGAFGVSSAAGAAAATPLEQFGFDADVESWVAGSSSVLTPTWTGSDGRTAAGALTFTTAGHLGDGGMSPAIDAPASGEVSLSMWTKTGGPTLGAQVLQFSDAAGTTMITSGISTATHTGDWQRQTLSVTLDPTCVTFRVGVSQRSSSTGSVVFIDDVAVSDSLTPVDFQA